MNASIRYISSLLVLCVAIAGPLPSQERTVIRHATPEEGEGLVVEKAPPSAERRRALEAWHRRYVRRARPVRREARDVLRLPDRTEDLETACHELGGKLLELGDAGIQNAPHFALRRHVDAGFGRLGRAVAWCLSGQTTRAHLQWVEAEKAFRSADRLLMRLGF